MKGFHLRYGESERHAAAIKSGIARMPENFTAELCWACTGLTERMQTYTAGCGGGYHRMMGNCEYCCGGLQQGGKPAHGSVVYQVLNAAN